MVTSTSATSVATSTFSQESSTLHEDLENSQFMQLMQQLANGQLSVVDGKVDLEIALHYLIITCFINSNCLYLASTK